MQFSLPLLPITGILDKLQQTLEQQSSVILCGEPGSGKTTIVPLALLREPWLKKRKIIILEPRRLAARMAASRMSEIAGDKPGGLVGYRIRFDTRVSAETVIEVVTEGVFLRMIQNDPELAEVGMVIFDEFHERSINSDLALALSLDVLEMRDDLKLIVMSATLDSDRLSKLLGQAPVISAEGRCFPVSTQYLSRPSSDYLVPRTLKAIHRAIHEQEGDILVFLPGVGEIKAIQRGLDEDILCLPLYGDLPRQQQELIFTRTGRRRLILATPIAETSLTIEGISVVIDSGMMKSPRFSATSGLTALHTIPISKASAKQRAGRGGRLGPGHCYRLWTEMEHHSRPEFLPPEILGADLAPLLLQTLQWGVGDPEDLHWLDPPRKGQVEQARRLLSDLGAINSQGRLTKSGSQIASLPLHPRLALMLLRGREMGQATLACRLAALLQNRDLFRAHSRDHSVDVEERLDILRLYTENKNKNAHIRARGAEPSHCARILREARQYQKLLNSRETECDVQESGNLLAFAYPDRIARKPSGASQHLLASGRGVILPPGDHLQKADFLVAANVDGGKKQGKVFLAAALVLADITANHGHLLAKNQEIEWRNSRVEARSILSLGKIEISRTVLQDVDPVKVQDCLLDGIRQTGSECLNWRRKSRELQARMVTAHEELDGGWPDVSDPALMQDLSWLSPYLSGISSLKGLQGLDLHEILSALLSWEKQQKL
ncbi:MAG: ATP-dependent helicase HrpB, partial [Thermodesulfobacteriota bacterium]